MPLPFPFRQRPMPLAALPLLGLLATALPAQALVNGVSTDSFAAVGNVGGASGVLIASQWVLTARHVGQGLQAGASNFSSLLGNSLIDGVYLFDDSPMPANDLALLHLSSAIAGPVPVLAGKAITGQQVAGYGPVTLVTGANQSPQGVGQATVAAVQTNHRTAAGNLPVNWVITEGPVYVQGGDSGSALFKGSVTDTPGSVLIGIASSSMVDAQGVHRSAYVQVGAYRSWIDQVMASGGPTVQAPSGGIGVTGQIPEPHIGWMLALGLPMVWAVKRRHRA